MAAKIVKAHPLNSPHTAGIFSDMSIDGPEIGTLVLVVDRAKNLPNRKTIGKQDPYCAARLGKEAKKTTTDVRGGQTPRWDQELRFTVHDSPDYYQLKISVFNDDKKTDLIGESWVDLHPIIIPGGGQNDLWQNLTYRGKYAGEIRIEITYYDTRPKPEKPLKIKSPPAVETDAAPTQTRMGPRRRPLPNEPSGAPPTHSSSQDATPRASYIPVQSPLQNLEYNATQAPPARLPEQNQYGQQPYNTFDPSEPLDLPSIDGPRQPRRNTAPYDHSYSPQQYSPQNTPDATELPAMGDPDDDRPPPPPVHRSSGAIPSSSAIPHPRLSYDLGTQKATPPLMRHDVLRNEAHRHSVPTVQQHYPGRPVYKAYDSAPSAPQVSPPSAYPDQHQPSPPRHHSYDSAYDSGYRGMQPTVEDAPDSPTNGIQAFRTSGSRMPQYNEQEYGDQASPAPLNLSGRNSALSGQYNPTASAVSSNSYRSQDISNPSTSMLSTSSHGYGSPRDLVSPSESSYTSYSTQNSGQYAPYRSELDNSQVHNANADQYGLPPVPPSLVPGVDPILAQEVSDRIYEERRAGPRRNTQMETPPTMRQANQRPQSYGPGGSPATYGTPSQNHSTSPGAYSTGAAPNPPIIRPRAISPNPSPSSQHTIKRKSVSPAPPTDGRRLSGNPFGPDSYDALNPIVSAHKAQPLIKDYSTTTNGKIISHDGKEVDPSDHLPMESWAPEPEPKKPIATPPSGRPSPAGAQPMPPSTGRRGARGPGRPASMATPPQYISAESHLDSTPSPPNSTGRNRLQKRDHRASALPIMPSGSSPAHSSPLALIPHPRVQDNLNHSPTPLRQPYASNGGGVGMGGGYSGTGATTWDFQNENREPIPAHRVAGGPPIPAKIPMSMDQGPVMSGALNVSVGSTGVGSGGGRYDAGSGPRGRRGGSEGAHRGYGASNGYGWGGGYPASNSSSGYGSGYGSGGGYGGSGDVSLEEEMSRIDIGTGRARRHGGGY